MRPLDIYQLGMRLADSGRTEAEHRAAIGRLYYGLHHEACCRYFREHPGAQPLGRGSRHAQLIERYSGLRVNETRRIQRLLRQLSRMRNLSDYELVSPVKYRGKERSARELMGLAVLVAEELLAALQDFSPGEAEDGCYCPVRYRFRA